MKKWLAPLMMFMIPWGELAAREQANDEAVLSTFIGEFFTEFARLSPISQNKEQKSVMPLVSFTLDNFTKLSEIDRSKGRVASIELVGQLFMHGPKAWNIEHLRIAGDVARVDIRFVSIMESQEQDIQLSFRLIRIEDGWKFMRFEDLRPKPKVLEVPNVEMVEQIAAVSPNATLKTYLDFMIDVYSPSKVAASQGRSRDISRAIEPLWVQTHAARRASGQFRALLRQIHPLDWNLVTSEQAVKAAKVTVELLVGNKRILNNDKMLNIMGGETPRFIFDLGREGKTWQLTGFTKMRQ